MNALKFVVVAIICCAVATADPQEASVANYGTEFDSIDVDQFLRNDEKLNGFCKCLLNDEECKPEIVQAKQQMMQLNQCKWIQNSLKDHCKQCSEKQKQNFKKIIDYLFKNKPSLWKKLERKYDPNHEYRKEYLKDMDTQKN